jgi:hypothetical protein
MQKECKVLIVPNGTGANVLSLRIACRRHESVLVSDISHIDNQESGSAEALVGCKLLKIPAQNGKISPFDIQNKIDAEKAFGRHATSPARAPIAQTTEVGTVYLDRSCGRYPIYAEESICSFISTAVGYSMQQCSLTAHWATSSAPQVPTSSPLEEQKTDS